MCENNRTRPGLQNHLPKVHMMIIGLLIPFGQMYQMASRHTEEFLVDVLDPVQQCLGFDICSQIAKKAGVQWVPVDYLAGSKRGCIILPLYERDDDQPPRMKAWQRSTCRSWPLKIRFTGSHAICGPVFMRVLLGTYHKYLHTYVLRNPRCGLELANYNSQGNVLSQSCMGHPGVKQLFNWGVILMSGNSHLNQVNHKSC
ncbi:hypothetical protein BD779DRAFT_1472109 [Infundibulicybe gibba]|nr:hypothetical protein BD779DRAFT_1472109 [Infundibulicybe gibba]